MENHILRNKRLLAVDDEPDVLDTLQEQVQEFEGLIFNASFGPEWRKSEKAFREMVSGGAHDKSPVILE